MIILIMSQNVPDTAQTISKTKTSDSTGGLKENSQSAFDKTSTCFISEVKSLEGFKIAALARLTLLV